MCYNYAMLSSAIRIPLMGKVSAGGIKDPNIDQVPNSEHLIMPISLVKHYKKPIAYEVNGESMRSYDIHHGDMVIVTKLGKRHCKDGDILVLNLKDNFLLKYYDQKSGKLRSDIMDGITSINFSDREVKLIGNVRKVMKMSSLSSSSQNTNPNRTTKLPIDKVISGDANEVLKKFPDNSIDIVVTSPPYDNIREYKGFSLDLNKIGRIIHSKLKDGGVVGMVIQDQTKNFGKSLTSFKTIISWCDDIGFKLFECLIYRKYGAEGAWWNKRFRVDHEYIPIFVKGDRPAYFDKQNLKIPSKHGGKTMVGGGTRLTNGVRIETRPIKINAMKCRGTIWEYMTAGDGSRLKHQHPATFPDKLPYDLISCFCPPNGVVLDPMCGSGTSLLAAKKLGRKYIGIDIAEDYCRLTEKRLREELFVNGEIDLEN